MNKYIDIYKKLTVKDLNTSSNAIVRSIQFSSVKLSENDD